jgi:putative transcriptional regulator
MIRHHPSDTLLVAASSGYLPEAHRRVLAVHLAMCWSCRGRQHEMQQFGGALLDSIPPAPMADDALVRTLARLDTLSDHPDPAMPDTPVTLSALASGRWRWVGPGVAMMSLLKRDEAAIRLDLMRVAPGISLFEHGHAGSEATVVMQGNFNDGPTSYGVGDFAEVDANVDHRPRAFGDQDCICLVATTGRLKALGWLGRVIRPLVGM